MYWRMKYCCEYWGSVYQHIRSIKRRNQKVHGMRIWKKVN